MHKRFFFFFKGEYKTTGQDAQKNPFFKGEYKTGQNAQNIFLHFFLRREYETTGQDAQKKTSSFFKGESTKQPDKMHKRTLLFKERAQNNWSKCTKEHFFFLFLRREYKTTGQGAQKNTFFLRREHKTTNLQILFSLFRMLAVNF